jgi:quinol monooxygenase YgiN
MASDFFVFTRVHSTEGQDPLTRKVIQDVLMPTRQEPGCLEINAYSSISDPGLFYINSRWKAEADFDQHLTLPHTRRFLADIQHAIDRPLEVTRGRPM